MDVLPPGILETPDDIPPDAPWDTACDPDETLNWDDVDGIATARPPAAAPVACPSPAPTPGADPNVLD
eukprot:177711-Amorphochlora_amoeboformis.AAC.1